MKKRRNRGWTGTGKGGKKPPPLKWWVLPLVFGVISASVMFLSPDSTVPPMDDTYIQLVFGRSLLSPDPLCFNPGSASSGFTSPLWLIPSGLASLAGTGVGPTVLMLLSLLFAMAAIALCDWRTGLLLALSGPFLFHSSSGMETAAACFMTVLLWVSIRDSRMVQWRPWMLAGAILFRPELVLLAVPLCLVTWHRGLRPMANLLLPSAALGGLWAAWNLHSTGQFLPSTFYAKEAASWFQAAGSGIPGLLAGIGITSVILPVATGVSTLSLIRGQLTEGRRTGIALAGFPILLTAGALATQPNSWFQMRYFTPALLAWILASGQWLSVIPRWRSNLAILAVSMIPGLVVFAGRRGAASTDVATIDLAPAVWLDENAESSSVVAAADIGAVRWITGLEILDLDGLVTPEMLPGRNGGWPFVQAGSDYLLAFPDQYSDLRKDGLGSLEFLVGFGSPRNVICGEDSVAIWKIHSMKPDSARAGIVLLKE